MREKKENKASRVGSLAFSSSSLRYSSCSCPSPSLSSLKEERAPPAAKEEPVQLGRYE